MTLEERIAAAWSRMRAESPVVEIAPATLTAEQVAALIDHTLLKPEAGEEQIRLHIAEAIEFGFATVCVNPIWTPLCAELLAGTAVKVCTVVGFPLGATLPSIKVYEVEAVAALGADEVDMVLAVGRLRDGDYHLVYRDIAEVADAAHEHDLILKVILETGLLTDEQKVAACIIAQEAGADFVKTATGFSGGGATVADIALMRRTVGPTMGVKAAGGVRTALDALKMVAAGATRIGTSGGAGIMRDLRSGVHTTADSEGLLMSERVSDFALIIGHIWRCTSCRDALLENPASMGVGYKLSETQRECLTNLSEDDFHTMMHLAEITGLTIREIDAAIDHPRARLRHLGSVKGELRSGLSW